MRNILLLPLLLIVLFSTGCAGGFGPMPGYLYSDIKGPLHSADNASEGKTGKACAHNYLGLVGVGDAGISDAMKNGGITQVTAVDFYHKNFWILWLEYCTIVTGK